MGRFAEIQYKNGKFAFAEVGIWLYRKDPKTYKALLFDGRNAFNETRNTAGGFPERNTALVPRRTTLDASCLHQKPDFSKGTGWLNTRQSQHIQDASVNNRKPTKAKIVQ